MSNNAIPEERLTDTLKHILLEEPTRWAELLLGMLKVALGISLVWYLWEPPTGASLSVRDAALIGSGILLLGVAQLVTVVLEWKWPRFVVSCLATGMWVLFLGTTLIATHTLRSILVFVPLLLINVVVALRVARIGESAKDGDAL